MTMAIKEIFVAKDGFWCEEFEYHKHHAERYPDAMLFKVVEQDDCDANWMVCEALARSVAPLMD